MKRRNFLKTAAAAGAGIGFPTIVPSIVFGANAPSNRVTLAQIGCGSRGRAVLSNIRRHAEIVPGDFPLRVVRRQRLWDRCNAGLKESFCSS